MQCQRLLQHHGSSRMMQPGGSGARGSFCRRSAAPSTQHLPRQALSGPATHRSGGLRRRHPTTFWAQNRSINIQIAASWGNGSGSPSGAGGEAAYADGQPGFGAFSSSSSGRGGSSGSGSSSPIAGLLSGLIASITAGPIPGAASPWIAAVLAPVVLWCATWVFTGGMFTLAQASLSGMCSVAAALHPTIPLRGAGYEDVAVSLVKMLHTGTDTASTWARPGLLLPGVCVRWLMGCMYSLAAGSTSIAAALMTNAQLLAVSAVSRGLLFASCLLFMLPLGSGVSSLASSVMQRLGKQPPAAPMAAPGGAGSSGSSTTTSGAGLLASLPISLPKLDDTSALALKLAGVLPWPCISAAAVLQPALLANAGAAPTPLALAAPQVLVCCAMLTLLLTIGFSAARFGWDVARRRADADVVMEFGGQVGLLCGLQAGLNVVQLALLAGSGQLTPQQLGVPLLSTLILGRVAWSGWRLHRLEANAASLWLQVLTLAPSGFRGAPPAAGGSGSGGSGSSWRRDAD